MRYSLFAGGKRIRPILCIEAARAVADDADGVAACGLLAGADPHLLADPRRPAGARQRRLPPRQAHQPQSLRRRHGDPGGRCAADPRLPGARAACRVDADRKSRLIAELATASGTVGGMIGGQVADLEGEGKPPDAQLLETIHRAKTGALLRASLRLGAIYAGADDDAVRRALLLRRARRAGLPDRGRHPRRGRVVRSARQDRRQGRAAAQDHLPRGLRPGRFAPHGGRGMRPRAPGAGAVRRPRARACTNWPT